MRKTHQLKSYLQKVMKKHRYSRTGKDFDLNFLCDMQAVGGRPEKGLTVTMISPFYEDYEMYEQARCILESGNNNGQILIRLPENERLASEMRVYLTQLSLFPGL